MPRIRTIKPELFLSETLAQVSLSSERTFTGLLTQADDRGRLRYSPAVINGALWPLRPEHTVSDLQDDVAELVAVGVICQYTAEDGKEYLHFPSWEEHQRISHPSTRNLCPACPLHDIESAATQKDEPIEPPQSAAPQAKKETTSRRKTSRGGAKNKASDSTPSGRNSEDSGKSPEGSGKLPEGSGKTPQGKERKGKERTTPPINRGGSRGGAKRSPQSSKTTAPKDSTEQDNDMGVYDTTVDPFTDLRTRGAISKGRKKIGKNGLDPAHADAVEDVIQHFIESRNTLGVKSRATAKGRQHIQSLLRGDEEDPYTPEQLKDLTTFAHQHSFWNGVIATPEALRKHAPRLYASDEYVHWSLENKRPADNRPRSTTTAKKTVSQSKKTMTADRKFTAADYQDQDL